MVANSWARLIGTSFGAALLAGVAQLGVVLGLGVIAWHKVSPAQDETAWRNLLSWLAFIFVTSVLCGGAVSRRRVRRLGGRAGATFVAVLAAAAGAAGAAPLVVAQARLAHTGGTHTEVTLAATVAAAIAIGVVLAYSALRALPVAIATTVTASWVWLLALTSAAIAIAGNRGTGSVRLGGLDLAGLTSRAAWWFSPVLTIGMAALLGGIVAVVGRWKGSHRLGIAVSGLAGPSLVASAYLIAGPALDAEDTNPIDPFVASILAGIAGLLVATAIAVVHRPRRASVLTPLPPTPTPTPAAQTPIRAVAAPQPAVTQPAVTQKAVTQKAAVTQKVGPRRAIEPAVRPAATSVSEPTAAPARAAARRATPPRIATPQVATPRVATPRVAPPRTAPPQVVAPRAAAADDDDDRSLRKHEREHVAWIQDLVNLPNNPELNLRRRP